MAQKKYSHRRMKKMMKEDEFASTIDKVINWMKPHKITVISGMVLLFVVVGIYVVAMSYTHNRQDSSEKMMANALEIYYYQPEKGETPKYETPLAQRKAALKEFQHVIDEKPTSSVAQRASFYMATSYVKLNQLDKAIETLSGLFAKADYPFKALVGIKYAALLENNGKLKDALEVYNELAEKDISQDTIKDYVLLQKGELLKKMGKLNEAKATFNMLVEKFHNSIYEKEAQSQLDQMGS
ncbi:MAG: tetratricopeptide repeat protein [Acidobacteria bacterium]|nr:tetratricopeptide repeat protein [Acidobacteriota bacterium]